MKTKKITVKPFLNKKLEPECSDSTGKDMYPLYYQITYERKNTQIRSYYGFYYDDIKEVKELIEFETNMLYNIIRYEATKDETKLYDLKRLKNKYEVYSISIKVAIDDYLKKKLRLAVLKANSKYYKVLSFTGGKLDFKILYEVSEKLMKNLGDFISKEFKHEMDVYDLFTELSPVTKVRYDFPTLIDWKNGSFKDKFEISLNKKLKSKKEVMATINSIELIVNNRLRNIVDVD